MCYDQAKTQVPMPPGGAIDPGFYPKRERDRFVDQGSTSAQIGREMSDEEKVQQIFTGHLPNPYTGPRFETIRSAAKHLAEVILANTPRGADRSAAIRKVREAIMTANAGISLDGLSL